MNARIADDGAGKSRRIKRSALSLAVLAVAFYLGFIAWAIFHGFG